LDVLKGQKWLAWRQIRRLKERRRITRDMETFEEVVC
jgi:hypothetical protein